MRRDLEIYPKQFRAESIPIERNRVFVLMPFKNEYHRVYGAIKEELTAGGFICNRADEIGGSKPILNKILCEIMQSRYVIADLSDLNPNVFYELGITHSFKDVQNVLLIKNKRTSTPFDITHLTYHEYDADNLFALKGVVMSFVEDGRCLSDFHEALDAKGVISTVSENKDTFVDVLQSRFERSLEQLTYILRGECSRVGEADMADIFSGFEDLLREESAKNDQEMIGGITKTYFTALASASASPVSREYVLRYMKEVAPSMNAGDRMVTSWHTDLMIALAETGRMLDVCLPWIVGYFSRSKAGTVDLNRYKLEKFLMTSGAPEVNEAVANALFDEDPHVREHMADIVGEKGIREAKDSLYAQLDREVDCYAARSMFQAISKLGCPDALEKIEGWLDEHGQAMIDSKTTVVIRHLAPIIAKLDDTGDGRHIADFTAKYKDLLHTLPIQ